MRAPPDPGPTLPAAAREALTRCASGELPANVALMHVLACSSEGDDVTAMVGASIAGGGAALDHAAKQRLQKVVDLHRQNPGAGRTVRRVLAAIDHSENTTDAAAAVARCAAAFDHAGRNAPEAAVALYALGDPDLLGEATSEIVRCMAGLGLLGPDRDLLEIGCGIGRILAEVAPCVRHAIGTEISAAMLRQAQERCAGRRSTGLVRCTGRNLHAFRPATFDTICAVDVFPYLVQAGEEVAAGHLRGAAHVLRPGGALFIANYSYRGDRDADMDDVARLAEAAGLLVEVAGSRPFRLWDGLVFLLRRSD